MTLKEDILNLRDQGFSYNKIIEELGCAKSTVAYYCGHGQKDKQYIRNRDTRSKLRRHIQETKTVEACMDCGVHYPYYMMDFDHRPDEEKLYTISITGSIPSMKALVDEIAKCDIICANCHRHRTWSRLITTGAALL